MQTGLNALSQRMSHKCCGGPRAQANHHPIFNQLRYSFCCLLLLALLLWIRELHRTFPLHICLPHALSHVSAHDASRLLYRRKLATARLHLLPPLSLRSNQSNAANVSRSRSASKSAKKSEAASKLVCCASTPTPTTGRLLREATTK